MQRLYERQKDWIVALVLFAAVAVLHGAVLFGVMQSLEARGVSLDHYLVSYDATEYVALAHQLLAGNFNTPGTQEPEVFRTPGYPAIAAAVLWLTGSLFAVVAFNILLLAAAAVGAYYLARGLLSQKLSFLAALAAMAGFDALELTASGMGSDAACILLFVCSSLVIFGGRPATVLAALLKRAFILGLLCGAAVLVRPVALYMAPLFALALAFRSPDLSMLKRGAGFAVAVGVCALVLLPWYARNAAATGTPMLFTLTAYNITYYNIPQFLAAQRGNSEAAERAKVYAEFGDPSVAELRSAKLNPRLREISKEFLVENWRAYAPFHIVKTLPFFFSSSLVQFELVLRTAGFPPVELSHGGNLTSSLLKGDLGGFASAVLGSWPTLLEALFWLAVFALALIGLLVAWLGRRSGRDGFVLLALGAAAVGLNAALSGVVAQPRYRAPMEFFIFIAAAYGACELYARRQRIVRFLRAWHNSGHE